MLLDQSRGNAWSRKFGEGGLGLVPAAYSPELNGIGILWKKIKYERLPWAAFHCFDTLRTALLEIFDNLGGKCRISYG